MPQLKFGFVGAGMVARYSADSVASHPDATLAAAFDPHAGRLSELCDKFDIPRRHDSLEAILHDDDLDAIYVAVPNKFHAPIAHQVIDAGKHLFLDKPFALNYAEAKGVADAAAARGKVFHVGMNQRFPAGRQRLRQAVQRGELGVVYHVKGYWLRRAGIPRLHTWFGHKAISGGGCMLDIGVHMLDLALFLAGNFEPVSVVGKTYTKFGDRGLGEGGWGLSDRDPALTFDVDDFASAFIAFRNGMTMSLDVSWAAHQETANVEGATLFGTDAGASVDPAKIFQIKGKSSDYEVTELSDEDGDDLEYATDRFHNFTNHVLGREPLCCDPGQSLVVQKILDAIYESSKTGQQITIS